MGKSRYDSLVKLKKKSLDEAERTLIAANNEVAGATDSLSLAYELLSSLSLPTEGSIRELTQAAAMIHTQQMTIEESKERLRTAELKQKQAIDSFNLARIDYEKFNYLAVQEVQAHMKKLKEQEAKMLDEIGTMTYKKGRK